MTIKLLLALSHSLSGPMSVYNRTQKVRDNLDKFAANVTALLVFMDLDAGG